MNWYKIVNTICRKLSAKYNVPIESVVGILVTLSAQKDWKTNIRQTIQFLKYGRILDGMYSQVHLTNCKRIVNGIDPLDIWGKNSFKYRNFYGSIIDPEDTKPVCIDTHMINWYKAKYQRSILNKVGKEKIFTSKRYYTLIQNAVRKEAKIMGLIPSHTQAVIWVNQRKSMF